MVVHKISITEPSHIDILFSHENTDIYHPWYIYVYNSNMEEEKQYPVYGQSICSKTDMFYSLPGVKYIKIVRGSIHGDVNYSMTVNAHMMLKKGDTFEQAGIKYKAIGNGNIEVEGLTSKKVSAV